MQLTLSSRTWLALTGFGISIVGSIWAFTITVFTDIREIKTDVHAVHGLLKQQETRIERLEGVYIVKP